MTPVDLLQQVGFNKYEAEAYHALLASGPLTGYELGKRSQVPLSRSYEILERLLQKGLAVLQPGDPPHYAAEEPAYFLGRLRATFTGTLDALTEALALLAHRDAGSEFWVIRGSVPIVTRLQALLAEALQTIDLTIPAAFTAGIEPILTASHGRGCRVRYSTNGAESTGDPNTVLLLVDDRLALAGVLSPAEHCQALCCTHPALLALLRRFFSGKEFAGKPVPVAAVAAQAPHADWVAWETRKQQQLWRLATGGRVA